MPVYYGFTRWVYGGETYHAGKAMVVSHVRNPVRPGSFLFTGPFPGDRRLNTVFPPIQSGAS